MEDWIFKINKAFQIGKKMKNRIAFKDIMDAFKFMVYSCNTFIANKIS